MSTINNPVCRKYGRAINDEIAWGEHFTPYFREALEQYHLVPGAKEHLGIAPDRPATLLDLAPGAFDAMSKQRVIYLVSLLEAFAKEYVAFRDTVDVEAADRALAAQATEWQRRTVTRHRKSTSSYNMEFLRYAFEDKYRCDFAAVGPLFWEFGVLRNCLTHHQGVIIDEALLKALPQTVAHTGIPNAVGSVVPVGGNLCWVLIEGSRQFIRACDVG